MEVQGTKTEARVFRVDAAKMTRAFCTATVHRV